MQRDRGYVYDWRDATRKTFSREARGDGYWQYNWQTSTRWRNTCRLMLVTFDDGSTTSAKVAFS